MRSIKHPRAYESLRKRGHSKESAARIANSVGKPKRGRSTRKGRR